MPDLSTGSILIIVIGGNISQQLLPRDGEQKLEPAPAAEFYTFLIKGDKSNSIVLREGNVSKQIIVKIERLIDIEDLEQQDSSQVNPKIWEDLAKRIKENYEHYEGFVVLHGLDTLAYTASAISFMFRNLTKPIVFTGSQRPLNFLRSDAPQNIYTALTIAASKSLGLRPPINEVTIYLHDTLYRANRASMSSASSYRSFDSLNYPALATIGEHVDIKDELIFHPLSNNIIYSLKADKKVQIIDVFPGMSSSLIDGIAGLNVDEILIEKLIYIAEKNVDGGVPFPETDDYKILMEIKEELTKQSKGKRLSAILNNAKREAAAELIDNLISIDKESADGYGFSNEENVIKGVILRTYGMGTLPTDVLKALRKLVDNKIVVMNVTQAHSSRVSFNSDLVSLRLFEHGVISGLDMTSEAAFAKMVIILSNNIKGVENCEDELQQNISGEQSHTVLNFHFEGGETSENENENKKIIFNYASKLKFLHIIRDFAFNESDISRMNNVQLRILGLKKKVNGGGNVRIKLFRCDDVNQKIIEGKEIFKFQEILEDPLDTETKTVNVSFDITNLKEMLFNKDAVFYIVSDQKIVWSRISIVVYK
jgi:L-asparaginase/Glu-tRNA(Gln) amidotransferase subunit D